MIFQVMSQVFVTGGSWEGSAGEPFGFWVIIPGKFQLSVAILM